jgi:hypothetical protein
VTAPLDLAALRALTDAATPEPWLWSPYDGAVVVERATAEYRSMDGSTFTVVRPGPEIVADALPNAKFIAAARTAIPALLDAIGRVLDQHVPKTVSTSYAVGECDDPTCGWGGSVEHLHDFVICAACGYTFENCSTRRALGMSS